MTSKNLDTLLGKKTFKQRIKAFAGDRKTMPQRITSNFLDTLVSEGRAIRAPEDYIGASQCIAETEDRLIILPYTLQVSFKESNKMFKEPVAGEFISYNSKRVVQTAIDYLKQLGRIPLDFDASNIRGPAVKIFQEVGMDPELLLRAGIEMHNGKPHPPIGLAWTKDKRKRLTTWKRIADAYALADLGVHVTLEKNPQGNTIKCWAPSESHSKRAPYSYRLRNLPITDIGDRAMYSMWLDLETNDPDPDGDFRGSGFNKIISNIFWTRNSITGLIMAGRMLKEHPLYGRRMMHVNPFNKLNQRGKNYNRQLDTTCIMEGRVEGRVPNMTVEDVLIGARLIDANFDSYFHARYRLDRAA